jgi:uncharacterized cupredoxin-like copper-binding protein
MSRIARVVALLLAVTGCAPHAPREDVPTLAAPAEVDWSAARPVEVVLADFSFTPETLALKEGQPYRLRFVNQGSGTHDFSAPDFFKTVALAPGAGEAKLPDRIVVARGASREITLVPLRKGAFPSECTVTLHATFGMTGKVIVE